MMDDFEKLFRKSFEKPANDLYEMELIGDHQMRIGVPIDAPEELKRRVLAAMKSYQARLKSVDYTLKRYGEYWKYPDPSEEESFLLYTLRALDQRVET
ncbi:MAG: hypothetical protein Q8L06_15140, partial [Pseudohongiella sp.]|nr:hypothetical protein [Pseudohongiella sp.]